MEQKAHIKTQAALPFELPIKDGAKYHEPLAHYDGCPLASVIKDTAGSLFFAYAARVEGWEWPLLVVPINSEEAARLELPDDDWPNGSIKLFRELLTRADGYYLWEMLHDVPDAERIEFVEGPVPETHIPGED
jgi:hypothetical protein